MSLEDLKKQLLKFYSNQENMNLIDYYSRTTFFDLIKKSRSETVHSAFLAWILEGSDFPNKGISSNLMHFLQMLVKKKEAQEGADFDDDLYDAICSGNLDIDDISVETEKPVQDFYMSADSKDRLDIFVQCKTNIGNNRTLQIFIENKVGTKEGGPHEKQSKDEGEVGKSTDANKNDYNKPHQTERYYTACHETDGDKIQLFVFLTAISQSKLDNFNNLKEDEKSKCANFINICYQDILDNVLLPLRTIPYISTRASNMIDEYINCLGIPSIGDSENGKDTVKQQLIMAIPKEERNTLKKFFTHSDNKDLLREVLDVVALNKVYQVKDRLMNITEAFENYLSDGLKRTKWEDELIISNTTIIKKYKNNTKNNEHKKGDLEIQKNILSKLSIRSGLILELETPEYEIDKINKIENEIQSQLENFWEKNQTLLLVALKVLSDETEKEDNEYYVTCYNKLTKRDLSKFTIGNKDGLGKTDVVQKFIEHLIKYNAVNNVEDFVNGYLKDVSTGSSQLGVLMSEGRYNNQKEDDKKRKDLGKGNSVLASDRYRRFEHDNTYYYVSTQWGGQYNSKAKNDNFPKLWKKIDEYNNQNDNKDHLFIVELTK